MQRLLYVILSACLALSSNAFADQQLYVCKGKYALCTTAACKPIAGNKNVVSCDCGVKNGFSAGQKQCTPVKKTEDGEIISSRYYPIKRYVVCSNDRPWAWCLDKPCFVSKKNPFKATCACDVVKNLGDYVIVTSKNTPTTCTTGVISSATVKQSEQITDFLKTQRDLKPYTIQVLGHD